ncbi:aminotransferase class IV [Antarcticibacterium sp. 1MA-6-2]|uniref:aminotransferase class IV n=1 Tax=Antarcticibacterium sp. 1MA-6-2 TaxID=2908210 RepID=UPI001F2C6EB1|nr:aminotransferase class IV [Antarcticibacterium sp. 1MA-6-2]UJH92385.1 aminotransferase class IV [Antarcticibacterium sp. 1MA-6-2]
MREAKSYPQEVYFNGKWMKPGEAYISVFDRGFMFGDGIYEVTPFYGGKPFKLKEHLKRLQYCLDQVQIKFEAFSLEALMAEAVSRAGLAEADAAVYIQVTRGVAPRSHFFPENIEPTVLLYAYKINLRGFETNPLNVLASEDKRWHRCDIKATALMGNILANEEAIANNFDENIMVRNGYFSEGSHTNIFFVKNATVYTHPEGPHILSGITRQVVIDLCTQLRIKFKLGSCSFG